MAETQYQSNNNKKNSSPKSHYYDNHCSKMQSYSSKNDKHTQNQKQNRNSQQIFNKIKMKVAASKMIANTKSYMLKNLTPLQYYLINDKSQIDVLNVNMQQILAQSNRNQLPNTQSKKELEVFSNCRQYFDFIKQNTFAIYMFACFKRIPIISPSSLFKYTWDFFHMMVILIYLFLIPIHIAFEIPFSELISQWMADMAPISFIVDTLINLNTGYYDKGISVKNKWKIYKHYLNNNFLSDILAVIPNIIYHYSLNQNASYDPNVVPKISTDFKFILRFFLLFFFMKLSSFNEIIKKLEERSHLNKRISNIIQFIKLLFTIVIIAHIFACLWVFVANIESNYNLETWMDHQEISQAHWMVKYIRAYYFSVVTMITVGYGDVLPKTDYEMLLSVISIMISCGVYAYLFNEVGSLFNEFSRNKKKVKQNMQIINHYMHNKGIDQHMQYQVRDYLKYFWKEQIDRDEEAEQSIINLLSDELKQNLLIEANKIILKDSSIFANNFSDLIIQRTVSLIQEQRVLPEQIIVHEGSYENNCIYFIEKGSVEIIISNLSSQEGIFPIQILKQGQCFEAESFFTGNAHKLTIRSKEFTSLLYIRRSDFVELLKEYPDDYEKFCVLKDQIALSSNYDMIDLKCQSCSTYKHTSISCQYLHFYPIKSRVIAQYNKINNNDKRQEYKRQETQCKTRTLIQLNELQSQAEDYQEENEETITDYLIIKLGKKLSDLIQNLNYDENSCEQSHNSEQENEIGYQIDLESNQKPRESNVSINKVQQQISQTNDQMNVQSHSQGSDKTKILNNFSGKSNNQQISSKFSVNILSKLKSKGQKLIKKQNQVKQNLQKYPKNRKNTILIQNQNQNIVELLQAEFKILKEKISSFEQKNSISDAKNENIPKQQNNFDCDIYNGFDCMKNYRIYLPFNNLEYIIKVMKLPSKQKQFFSNRQYLDNKLFYKKLIVEKQKAGDQRNDIMGNLIKKYQQQEKEQQREQSPYNNMQDNVIILDQQVDQLQQLQLINQNNNFETTIQKLKQSQQGTNSSINITKIKGSTPKNLSGQGEAQQQANLSCQFDSSLQFLQVNQSLLVTRRSNFQQILPQHKKSEKGLENILDDSEQESKSIIINQFSDVKRESYHQNFCLDDVYPSPNQ